MEIEVSKKVRAAIKAKLLELGVHVDEELPDYVMVLIANRRSKVQMEQDLNLFLADNTSRFVIWLHHVLKKLDEVTAHLPAAEQRKRKSSVEEASTSKKCKEDKVAKEEVKEVVEKETKKQVEEKSIKKESRKAESEGKKKAKEKDKVKETKKDQIVKEDKLPKSNLKFKLKTSKKIGKSSIAEEEEDKSVKLTLLDGDNEEEFISLNVNSNEFEFDEVENLRQMALESQKRKVQEMKSSDKVEEPKTPVAAVAQAQVVSPQKTLEKSDKSPKKSKEPEKCSKSEKDKSDRFYKAPRRSEEDKSDRKSRRELDKKEVKRLKSVIKVESGPPEKKVKSQVIKKEEEYDPLKPVISTKKLAVNNLILKAVAEAQKSVTEFAILEIGKKKAKPSVKDRLGSFVDNDYTEEELKKIVIKVPKSPERINIRVDSTEESTSDDDEYEIIEEIVEEEQTKEVDNKEEVKAKPVVSIQSSPKVILKERPVERPLQTVKPLKLPSTGTKEVPVCKYWPTCTFKEKCIYPHPKCKFGSKCTKLECAYKHDKDVCKFFPNCHSLSCSFYHPSPCRFGNGCKDLHCQLFHPGRTTNNAFPSFPPAFNSPVLPAKHLLKWKKN